MFFCWLCMALPYYLLRSATCCPFPDFLQSGDSTVEWLGEGSEEGANFTATVTFHGRTMRSMGIHGSGDLEDEEWTRRRAFQRECLIEVTGGRFLCSHRHLKDDYENRYVCMEFVIRSEVVIQLRESSVIRFQDPRLCSSDQLRLNDRPLVNRDGFFAASHPCPAALTGGYNVRLYDRRHGHGVCDAFEGTTRIEAQCSSEDQGLVFRFRFPQCVPEGLGMNTEQRTFCLASWTDDENTYCVIRHDRVQRAWCLRYHTRSAATGTFATYLFTGLRCNRDPVPIGKVGSIVLDMRLDLTPRSMCADDYEACMWENPCKDYWPDMQLACPRRCGVCNDTLPRLCTLPSWIRGKWMQTDLNETLEVGEGDITLSSLEDRYRCVDWQKGSQVSETRGRHGTHSADIMLVKTSTNGCRHRYICAQWRLVHHSMSFLLKFRFSRSQLWPFDGATPFGPIGCHLFQYGDDVQPFLDRYTSHHFKTLVHADAAAVDCDFPKANGDEVTVTFRHLPRCSGHLKAFDDRGVVKMRLVVSACPGGWHIRQFTCVGRTTSHSDETFIVTYLEQTSEYHCWIFSSTLSTDFYLLSLSDCAAEAYGKIRSGLIQPVMSFHSGPNKTESNTSMQNEISSVYGTASPKGTPTAVHIDDNVTRTTASMMLSDDESHKSFKDNLWESSAARAQVEKVTHTRGISRVSTPAVVLNDEYHNNRSNTNKINNIGNVRYIIGNTTEDIGNSGDDIGNSGDNIGNYSADSRILKTDNLEAGDADNQRKKDEVVNNADYRRGERSQTEFNNGLKANGTNDTSEEEDNITKETELDLATTATKLDYGDVELIGRREHTTPADIESFRRLNKSLRSGADDSFEMTKLSNRFEDVRHSSKDDVDDEDVEGSSYQQADDNDVDDDDDSTTSLHQTDDIDVIDDSNQLSTPSLSENITDADDVNVTSVFNQVNDVLGNSSNDVKMTPTTIVSLKPMAITSSASTKTSTDRSFFKAISVVYAFFSWNLATTISA